jgi:pyruvate ferredoxin oxidoreductase gamma subunit
LAEILSTKFFVQSFAEFGAEKRGAPVTAFNRISTKTLREVSQPKEVDGVILVDPTLVFSGEIPETQLIAGLKKSSKILVNCKDNFDLSNNFADEIFVINASKIAIEEIGREIPNVPILATLIKIFKLCEPEEFFTKLEKILTKSLPAELVEGNLRAAKRGFEESSKLKVQNSKKLKIQNSKNELPSWKNLSIGAIISKPGNSKNYNTGNWVKQVASQKPTTNNQQPTCAGCGKCKLACPEDAIKFDKNGKVSRIDETKCKACGLCVIECPLKCLTLVTKS